MSPQLVGFPEDLNQDGHGCQGSRQGRATWSLDYMFGFHEWQPFANRKSSLWIFKCKLKSRSMVPVRDPEYVLGGLFVGPSRTIK